MNTGSSPHPWGTRALAAADPRGHRFIPTPVGNANVMRAAIGAEAVHPHTRGERASPRGGGERQDRFIPTPVGNADLAARIAAELAVHPHTRGERSGSVGGLRCHDGSSPHPWGTLEGSRMACAIERFIPTPVGNACARSPWRSCQTVHPHTRGERTSYAIPVLSQLGSSPHPWGTLDGGRRVRIGGRFIPTPVGNATHKNHPRRPRTVHPHTRGERSSDISAKPTTAGSSPHPWGTPFDVNSIVHGARFIPTPVGNASMRGRRLPSASVHPHTRGERDCANL